VRRTRDGDGAPVAPTARLPHRALAAFPSRRFVAGKETVVPQRRHGRIWRRRVEVEEAFVVGFAREVREGRGRARRCRQDERGTPR